MPIFRIQSIYRAPDDDGTGESGANPASDDAASSNASDDAPASMEDAIMAGLSDVADDDDSGAGTDEQTPTDDAPATPAKAAEAAAVDGSEIDPLKALEAGADSDKDGDKETIDPDAELNAPPAGLSKRAAERWDKMTARSREHREAREAAEAQIAEVANKHNELIDQITSTGANEQEFGQALAYMRAVHSDDPQQLQLARDTLRQELDAIEARLGIAPSTDDGGDALLAQHPDIQALVDNLDMTREAGLAMAADRRARQALEQRSQQENQRRAQQQQRQEQTEAQQTEIRTAAGQVAQIEAYLAKHDPSWPRKAPLLVERAKEICQIYKPAEWAQRVGEAYKQISQTMQAGAPQPRPGRHEQPLRSGGSNAGSTPALPETMEGAIMQDLGIST